MLRVGLTGGIGAGKSSVASVLVRRGAVLIDADRLAREVVAPGTDGLAAIVATFGAEVVGPDGSLDRAAMAARVFGDDAARKRLEGIIHPLVRGRTGELMAAAPAHAVLVNDVPLLVESGLTATYHLVIVVEAAPETRVARLAETRGMSRDEALGRIRAQAGDDLRRAAADVLLTNDGTRAELDAAVEALWRERLAPFEENLRMGRVAPGDRALSDADYERLAARITWAAGSAVASVRRGDARLRGAEDIEVVAAGDVDDALGAAGFVRADEDGRAFGSADPGRPATVVVTSAGRG